MMEPRGTLHSAIILRRESTSEKSNTENNKQYIQHDEPETPAHPELEYELYAEVDSVCTTNSIIQEIFQSKTNEIKLCISFIFLVLSGVGTIVTAKLQAIPMYNYPNFINLFTTLLYVPICFAYIVPASHFGWNDNNSHNHHHHHGTSSLWPRKKLLKRFVILGALDSISTTLQTFAAVYLPGPLLILLPQAAIPVSLVLNRHRDNITKAQWIGAATVFLGVLVVLQPVLFSQNAPDYYCEAADRVNDCVACKVAITEEACNAVQATTRTEEENDFIVALTSRRLDEQGDDTSSPCQWLPYNESSHQKEFLEILWSVILVFSTFPMALSAIFKQRAMLSLSMLPQNIQLTEGQQQHPPPPALYVSGWIALFQFVWSLLIAVPAGMLTAIHPLDVPENLWNGMLCYAGYGVIETGCHPDTQCASFHTALWVHVSVLCHVVYTISMMLVLKYSGSSSTLLFLALTAIVPLGHLVFTLPFLPMESQAPVRTADLAGLIVILAGLLLYRFSDSPIITNTTTNDGDNNQDDNDETARQEGSHNTLLLSAHHKREISLAIADLEDNDDSDDSAFASLLCSLWPVENQTSYALLREPVQTGDV